MNLGILRPKVCDGRGTRGTRGNMGERYLVGIFGLYKEIKYPLDVHLL